MRPPHLLLKTLHVSPPVHEPADYCPDWSKAPLQSGPDKTADTPATHSQRQATATGGPQIIGERAHRLHFIDAYLVDYLEVSGNYVTIHVGEDRFVTRATLKYLASLLAPYGYLQIGRSLLLNLRQVAYVEKLERQQFAFTLRGGPRLVSSRERSGPILRLLRSAVIPQFETNH